MKNLQLDQQEKEILESYEKGEWKKISDFSQEARHLKKAAAAALRKDCRVNIRLASRDLEGIRSRAAEEGIPFQTLMASILHKYVNGRLVSRS